MSWDVIIAGAGPAGLAAAFAAEAEGAKVLLLEHAGFVGGMLTEGMIHVLCGMSSASLYKEITKRLIIRMGHRQVYDTESMKEFFLEKLLGSSIELMLHTTVLGADCENGSIKGIRVLTRGGIEELTAPLYIDATGNGDLAFNCGVGFDMGREEDGLCLPASLYMRLAGVDTRKFTEFIETNREAVTQKLQKAVADGEVPAPAGHVIMAPEVRDGYLRLNMTNATGVDGTDSRSMTRAELLCRSQVQPLLRFIRRNVPGCEQAFVVQTASYTGVRESRRFHCVYQLNEYDLAEAKVFDDWIATRCRFGFDVHDVKGHGIATQTLHAKPDYTIPYRSLQPLGVDNLLLAGRCIGGTHLAHSSYRVMPICMAMGQAAGVAAAQCARRGVVYAEADVAAIQKTLLAQGISEP
ncbi:MAG: FAD-dependent oxidoreductase [Clostridia bacterium]|nr:FAD-dependent oxidoreductase [Clostridia bacterium]